MANIAKAIAEAEGFDVTYAVIAGLLHDIAYCEKMVTREDRLNHGRRSAAIARPFFDEMPLGEKLEKVSSTIEKLEKFKELKFGTSTSKKLWLERLDYYIGFYKKLESQFENSRDIL